MQIIGELKNNELETEKINEQINESEQMNEWVNKQKLTNSYLIYTHTNIKTQNQINIDNLGIEK